MTIIHVVIRFCMVLNPTMCRELEIAPADHETVSQTECMRGVMMGDQSIFLLEGIEWRIRGGSCKEVQHDNAVSTWLKDQKDK